MKLNDTVKIVNKDKTLSDPFLEDNARKIIQECDFKGKITKIEDGIHFVGFKNENGWVTQGYKANEIEVVKWVQETVFLLDRI